MLLVFAAKLGSAAGANMKKRPAPHHQLQLRYNGYGPVLQTLRREGRVFDAAHPITAYSWKRTKTTLGQPPSAFNSRGWLLGEVHPSLTTKQHQQGEQ
jgi:hypothetical protein